MSYILKMFARKLLPIYLRQGDQQDIGTGNALTSFQPLPGGGFYDNYRANRSPQGIRPLSKSGLFLGTSQQLFDELQAWRALLGIRDRMVIEFDNGSLLWQWARLQNIETPRSSDNKGGWLPVTFTWITAAQNWRSYVHAPEWWQWGDDTWIFGDASAAFGVGEQDFILPDGDTTVTVTHNGTIDAPNVLLRLEMDSEWQDATIINETTGQVISIDRAQSDQTPWIEIDASARRIQAARPARWLIAPATHEYAPNRILVYSAGPHGMSAGDTMRLWDAGVYSGDYPGVIVEDAYTVHVPVAGDFEPYGTQYGGLVQGMYDIYNLATISDKKRWFILAPGANRVRVLISPFPRHATLKVSFDDHYA